MRLIYATSILLLLLGIYCVLTQKNLIKIVIGLNIMESAVILFFVATGYVVDASPPIIRNDTGPMVDPIPQALAITAIVIAASTTALLLTYVIKIYGWYNTLDITEILKKRKAE